MADWKAFDRWSPIGYRRHNLHAILAAMPYLKSGASLDALMFEDSTGELDAVYAEYQRIKAEREAEKHGDEDSPL